MPRRKPKPEKVVEEKIRESLDSIIMQEALENIIPDTDELPRLKTTDLMDFTGEKSAALSDAKALLDTITKFYMDDTSMGEASHVEFKKKVDAMNLSSMMLIMTLFHLSQTTMMNCLCPQCFLQDYQIFL